MSKFLFKCVSKEAEIACTHCPGSTTTFVAPTQTIVKEQARELAIKSNTAIVPFTGVCVPLKSACVGVALSKWQFINPQKKIESVSILIEKSVNVCSLQGGFITIVDKKQDIISINLAGMVLKAIKALECMLDFRLDQYNNDKASFDKDFETWFGEDHLDSNKQVIIDRMNNIKKLTKKMINSDGSLNEDYFEAVADEDGYGSYAYVYPNDPDNTVHIAPYFFNDGVNTAGMNSQAGTIGHEASHFNTILGNATTGTTDRDSAGELVYGISKSKQLAKDDPNQALIHADCFEFFLESGGTCS